MKTAIYLRVSTEHQSTDMQRHDLLKYCDLHGISEYEIYSDTYTGTKSSRPEFDRVIAKCRAGEIDRLIVWKFDRLSRRLRDFLNLMHELSGLGVAVISFKDSFDMSTPMGKAMAQMLLILSELEVENIRERTRAGMAAARARGKQIGRARTHLFSLTDVFSRRARGERISDIARSYGMSRSQLYRRLG